MKLFRNLFKKTIHKQLVAFQDDLIGKHLQEVENIYKQMRGWRHDYHNHIQTIKAYRALGQEEQLDQYLDLLEQDLNNVDSLIKSGNITIDAILNSKISMAKEHGIAVDTTAVVPESLTILSIDLCVIIGNLLDNAIEACLCLEESDPRFIRVYMDIKQNHFYLCITNTGPKATKSGNRFLSKKGVNHGFGLMRIDQLIEKYHGFLKRSSEEGAFTSEIIIPIDGP